MCQCWVPIYDDRYYPYDDEEYDDNDSKYKVDDYGSGSHSKSKSKSGKGGSHSGPGGTHMGAPICRGDFGKIPSILNLFFQNRKKNSTLRRESFENHVHSKFRIPLSAKRIE